MNRKVLFVHDGPRWKDTEGNQYGTQADIDMCLRYKYLGDEVRFAMRVFTTCDSSQLINLNEKELYIDQITPFNRPFLLQNYIKSKKEIKKCVENADIIVVRLPSTIGSVALNYAKKIGKPYIVEVVACPWDSLNNHSILGKFYAPLSRRKMKRLVNDSQYVIYVTNQFLQERYPTKYENIGISDVVLNTTPKENPRLSFYKNFDNSDRLVFTTLGVVNLTYKGQQYVLQAMAALVKEGYNVYYKIVGGGDPTFLKNLAKQLHLLDRVEFTGKLPHEEVFNVLEETDIYIQPSETEGLPRALIEAMSRGCVCIGSDAGGIPELLDKSALFRSKNVKCLESTIKSLLFKEKLLEHSIRNFKFAKKFDVNLLDTKRKSFYDKFLHSINEK